MNLNYKSFTLGVEEEYMVLDPQTHELKSHEQKIVHEGQKVIKDKVKAEMHQAVVEVGTDICQDVDEAFTDIALLRKTISGIAETLRFSMGAAGTHPFSHRYIADTELYRIKKGVHPQIPPDLFGIIDAICFDQQFYIIIISLDAIKCFRYAGTGKFIKNFCAK